jgi:hypothetical protein
LGTDGQVSGSETRRWTEGIGIDFHEARIETNAHNITLVFSDLHVSRLEAGYTPFVVDEPSQNVPPTSPRSR